VPEGPAALREVTFQPAEFPEMKATPEISAAAHQIDRGALACLAEQHHREDTDR
jgi:hypothetical protein